MRLRDMRVFLVCTVENNSSHRCKAMRCLDARDIEAGTRGGNFRHA